MVNIFADSHEFNRIKAMYSSRTFSIDASGIGDDGLILPFGDDTLVITSDASSENIHYDLSNCQPEHAFEKCLLSNLSDINAMGGSPFLLFLTLGASPKWDTTIYRKIGKKFENLARKHQFSIGGGDTLTTSADSFFSITAIGKIEQNALLRSNCRPGHKLYISGELGKSAAGLFLLKENINNLTIPQSNIIHSHHFPNVPLELGPTLSRLNSKIGAIDVSDGLSSEAGHLSQQSQVRIIIQLQNLPIPTHFKSLFSSKQIQDFIIHGGEDYQLLFSGNFSQQELDSLSKLCAITEIGYVEEGSGVFLEQTSHHQVPLEPLGWSH